MSYKHPLTGDNQSILHNSTGGSRVRTFSGSEKHDGVTNTPKEFADLIHLKNIYTENEEKPPLPTNDNLDSSHQDEIKTSGNHGNNSSMIIDIPHGNSHPTFHTGSYIPLSTADLTLEIHKSSERKNVRRQQSVERGDASGLLFTPMFLKQSFVMALWFFSSFATIVLNKYILSTLDVDASILGECQILMTTFLGCIMMYFPFCRSSRKKHTEQYVNKYKFYKTISLLGWLRCGAVICSVIGLKYVAVSFSETIKSSAPLFTAIMAYLMLGEYSGLYVNLSLLPIMFGLAISTYTEISFNITGFIAACSNNILDCIQNVFSKKLLCGEEIKYSPLELQFYTSVAATIVQLPIWIFFVDVSGKFQNIDRYVASILLFNGVIFYLQSLFAYSLMSLISPVTFSVSNTVKRAGLIWFSILVFGNRVTLWNGFGTLCVVGGVFLYQRARIMEASQREAMKSKERTHNEKTIV